MTTDRQKKAIEFCNNVLPHNKFVGDIDNFNEVSEYLSKNLANAKLKAHVINITRSYGGCCVRDYDYSRYISEDDLDNIGDPHWIVE